MHSTSIVVKVSYQSGEGKRGPTIFCPKHNTVPLVVQQGQCTVLLGECFIETDCIGRGVDIFVVVQYVLGSFTLIKGTV